MPGITSGGLLATLVVALSFATISADSPVPAGSAVPATATSAASSPTSSSPTAASSSGTAVPGPSVRLPLPGAGTPAPPAPVLPALPPQAPVPSPAGLTHTLAPLLTDPALGGRVGTEVIDVMTGASLFAKDATSALVPASAAKLLTAAAALSVLGPDATLATRTVRGAHPNEVVLVGGGDVLLSPGAGHPDAVQGHAGLADLAQATAAELHRLGDTAVTLRLDDGLFSGEAVNPAWWPGDVVGGFVAPVMAVEVTAGVTHPGSPPQPGLPAPRLADPAMSAAVQFAGLLAARGIVVAGDVARTRAPASATPLAQVRSASIADLVEHDLTDSDNTTAEALARLVAVAAGRPGTFAEGGRAVLAAIAALGVPTAGASMSGGSGLGRGTLLPVDTVARTLALAASPGRAQLRSLLTGLPVAGASGTLGDRFLGSSSAAGIGVVRAKTGTLTGVGALAGTVVDADARLLAFVLIANGVPATNPGRTALDAVAAALAGCGCR